MFVDEGLEAPTFKGSDGLTYIIEEHLAKGRT